MKNGWQTKRLGDVCEIIKGRRPALKAAPSNGDLPYLVAKVMRGSAAAEYASVKDRNSVTVTESETIIICDGSNSGEVFTGFRGILSSTMGKISKKAEIDDDYLRAFLASTFEVFNGAKTGAAIPHLDKDQMYQLELSLPPLPEQQRIVGFLDEAFDGIATAKANAQKNRQNAKALFRSALSRAVVGEVTKGWREERWKGKTTADSDLKELLERIKGRHRKAVRSEETTGHESITDALPKEWRLTSIGSLFNLIDYRGKNPPRSESGRRLITAKNIKMGYLADEPITFTSEETYRKWMVRGFPKPGDILFVTEGHTMGFVALNTRNDDFALAQRTITLQPAAPFSTKFFFYFMLSSYFQELVKLNATGAAAVGMKASKFRSLPLVFPPIGEQEIIVAKLDALSEETQRLVSLYNRKLAALAALKKSLLHQAFGGEL